MNAECSSICYWQNNYSCDRTISNINRKPLMYWNRWSTNNIFPFRQGRQFVFNLPRICCSMSSSTTSPLLTIILSILTSTLPFFWLAVLCLFALPKALSIAKPANTSSVPIHCIVVRGCLKISTEPSIVKNLRVVVITLHVSGPKCVTVRKIKFCK